MAVMAEASRRPRAEAAPREVAPGRRHPVNGAPERHRAASRPGRRRRRLPALTALVALFCMAGAIRLALGIGGALAEGASSETHDTTADSPAPSAAQRLADDGDTTGLAARDERDIADILLDIRRREAQLAERSEQLEERMSLLAAAEERVARQIDALRQAESELDATMALADGLAEGDLGRLVAVFEAMRAEQAARVFAEMDPSFAAGFLGRLRPETAAGILAGLEPRQAYALSTILAGRNALVPTRPDP